MANSTTAFGFRPVKEPDPSSILSFVAVSGTANLFIGDAVVPGGTGSAAQATYGLMDVVRAAAGDTNVVGVIVGFEPLSPDSLTAKYGATGAARIVKVVPAFQSTIFEVMANASLDVDSLGNGADIVAGAGSTTTGFSGMTCDTALATTGKTLRLIGAPNRPDNAIGASGSGVAGTKLYVFFAESIWNNGPGV